MKGILVLALLGALGGLAYPTPGVRPGQEPGTTSGEVNADPQPVFERVAVIGASLSGGYGLEADLRAKVRLGDVLDCMLIGPRQSCLNLGDIMLFTSPEEKSEIQVKQALAHEPTLVVAVDFLFWYAYGITFGSPEDRLRIFNRGLELLSRFDCPILIGDIPDMRMALHGEGPLGTPMITERIVPPEDVRTALNERLVEWARERDNVIVAPLSLFLETIQSGGTISLRGNEWEKSDLSEMLQKDLLHPRPLGVESLLVLTLDRLAVWRPDLGEKVCWDQAVVHERLLQMTRQEREKWEKAAARRAERKAKREKRDKGDGGFRVWGPHAPLACPGAGF